MKKLDEAVLSRLTGDAITTFLGEAERFEASAGPGLCLALCNEPVADMNMLIAGAGAEPGAFEGAARRCVERSLPFVCMVFPSASPAIEERASDLGLSFAVEFPFMVHAGARVEPSGNPEVEVQRGSGPADAEANARMLASAFKMPCDSAMRALPASLMESPGIDVFIARQEGDPVGAVTITYHGDTCGVWAMATDAARQRGGIGRRLLSSAMAAVQDSGARRFFLGATPAGFKLYEGLGYETRFAARVWVSGESNQT